MPAPVHWDEVEGGRAEVGHIAARWTDLGRAAGTRGVGLKRIQIDPGKWATPLHRHTAEEEIFFVLAGSGLSLQRRGEDVACELRVADCLVHRAGREAHTVRAGPDGLDVLAFGTRARIEIGELPRAGVSWVARSWAELGAGDHPWERESAAGEPDVPEAGERPPNVVNVDDAPGRFGGRVRTLGDAGGSERTGLHHVQLDPGDEGAPPHCHSAEEEIFVVLDGEGVLELTATPTRREVGVEDERHELRRGHVVSRPPGTGVAHAFRAGDAGLTLLVYGTREPNDITYYPRSQTFYLRGIGLHGRIDPVPLSER
jgi:uncharacterized cupin superfamily protein